ncbi:flagellar basal body L-ring protein [Oleiphilus sp. HI0125]|uniref:flagellar basal body L-ring protein FlgH n=1 Tax=Oleiphilus sp. HI0125 TaxID=1822266 RepID=UPI0007C3A7CF|nr:flagellar basal body L-ring protein FlgH [Oleiphilus sp. HI0125]KZZ59413.1 flagellar basal body L-ring protein [Oleiphilus sp. HI0125]
MLNVIKAALKLANTLAILASVGCAAITREHPVPDDPRYAPIPAQSLRMGEPVTGSIFQSHRQFSVYGDQVAINVGDILTVNLQESTRASKSADTTYDKSDEVDFNEASILGNTISFKGMSLATDPSFEREFEGSAESGQSNSLAGAISVTVAEVFPNGLLRVQGEKWLSLNQGDEYIRLTGLIRPQDIGIDNTVPSSKIANARIAYGGTGEFDQVNRQGWLTRFFNSEWWPL